MLTFNDNLSEKIGITHVTLEGLSEKSNFSCCIACDVDRAADDCCSRSVCGGGSGIVSTMHKMSLRNVKN